MKNCKSIQALLLPYAQNELSAAEAKPVETHLKTCSNCKALYAQYQHIFKQLNTWGDVEPSTELYHRLKHELELRKVNSIRKKLLQIMALKHYITLRRALLGIISIGLVCLFVFASIHIHKSKPLIYTDKLEHYAAVDTNHIPTLLDSILSFSSAPAKQTRFIPKLIDY